MIARSLLRLAAGIALALIVAMSWATPGKAHARQSEPAAATQQAEAEQATASEPMTVASVQVPEAAGADCGGHGKNDPSKASCCESACHAAMSTEMVALQAVAVAAAILPTLPAPPALSGPTIHIKRPPRPSAALVG